MKMCNSVPEVAEEQRGFVNLRNCDSVFPALAAPPKLRLCPGSKWQKEQQIASRNPGNKVKNP